MRAKIKDWIHKYVKIDPDKNIIIFDRSAQKLSNMFGRSLKRSKPANAQIKPNVAVICMNSFFFWGITSDRNENKIIGIEIKEGI